MRPDLIRAAHNIKRIFVEYIFVRILPPLKFFGIHFVGGLDHCNTDDDGGKYVAIGDMDLNSAAGFAAELGKGRSKISFSKSNTWEVKLSQLSGPRIRVDERSTVQKERQCRAAAFAKLGTLDMDRCRKDYT